MKQQINITKKKPNRLQWPSAFRALRNVASTFSSSNNDVEFEGGDAKENSVAPMVQFYPDEAV